MNFKSISMKRVLIIVLLALTAILCTACTKDQCELLIGEYTHQKGSDVYIKIDEFFAIEKPNDFEIGTIEHIFIIESECLIK
jgi:hypothetical protein